MANLYLFTGENAYALRNEKLRWIAEFTQKYGVDNLIRLEGLRLSFRELLDEVSSAPFIAPKRLIVIDGVIKASKEEIALLPTQIHPDAIVLIVDAKPDKRLAGVKQLLAIAETKEFAPLPPPALARWIQGLLAAEGKTLEPAAQTLLLDMLGNDQDLLSAECARLALAIEGKTITKADIEDTVSPTDEGIVWHLTDLLAGGKRAEALGYARRFLDRGGEAYGLWAILLNLLKNVTAVAAQAREGGDQKEIAEQTGLHFMAVRSLLPHARGLNMKQLQSALEWTVEADKALKTGGYRATEEAPEELLALIDAFLLKFPSTALRSS